MPNFLIVWPRAAAEETHKHKHSVRRPRYQGRCASVRLEDASPSCYYIGCLHFILLQWWKSSDQQQHWGKKKTHGKKEYLIKTPQTNTKPSRCTSRLSAFGAHTKSSYRWGQTLAQHRKHWPTTEVAALITASATGGFSSCGGFLTRDDSAPNRLSSIEASKTRNHSKMLVFILTSTVLIYERWLHL